MIHLNKNNRYCTPLHYGAALWRFPLALRFKKIRYPFVIHKPNPKGGTSLFRTSSSHPRTSFPSDLKPFEYFYGVLKQKCPEWCVKALVSQPNKSVDFVINFFVKMFFCRNVFLPKKFFFPKNILSNFFLPKCVILIREHVL